MTVPDDAPAGTTIQSVRRAARLLVAIAGAPDGLSAKEVAEDQGLALATTYHLLNTLAAERLLAKDDRRRYHLGPRAAVIAEGVSRSTHASDRYLAPLRELARRTGETAYLSAWRGDAVAILEAIEGQHSVRVAGLARGIADHPHARAGGKLLLAYVTEAQRRRVIRPPLRRLTPETICDVRSLYRELDKIRQNGIAYDHGEFARGVECVAVPITEAGVVSACYAVSVPVNRWSEVREHVVRALKAAAATASAA